MGWILPHDEFSTSSAQATSKLRIADERGCATLELGLVAEEQPRLAVLDDRTVPRDVRSEDGAAQPERLEHRVGHAALRNRAVHDHIRLGQERTHLGVRDRADVARPRDRRQGALQPIGYTRVEHRTSVEQPDFRKRPHQPTERREGKLRVLDPANAGGEHEQDPSRRQRPARGEIERLAQGKVDGLGDDRQTLPKSRQR